MLSHVKQCHINQNNDSQLMRPILESPKSVSFTCPSAVISKLKEMRKYIWTSTFINWCICACNSTTHFTKVCVDNPPKKPIYFQMVYLVLKKDVKVKYETIQSEGVCDPYCGYDDDDDY